MVFFFIGGMFWQICRKGFSQKKQPKTSAAFIIRGNCILSQYGTSQNPVRSPAFLRLLPVSYRCFQPEPHRGQKKADRYWNRGR